ncbi:MAG: hypothetical protein GC159_09410 [Phycisphaera sp.]|nr:hypothetical protein [Phycisphaera sp.]
MAASLRQHYPTRWYLPALVVANIALLIVALNLPFMSVAKLVFFQEDYSLIHSIRGMIEEHNYVLAVIIFSFSILFPFAKLAALLYLWFAPIASENRRRSLVWLSVLGKWSMLDVFVVAILIVLTQSKGYVDAEPEIGVYLFALAIGLSLVVSLRIEHAAKRVDGGDPA